MPYPLYQVDAFTAKPFGGNPAAVCLLPHAKDEVWMQNVAAEMNLAETAFLHPEGEGYRLRWFTPAVEVPLCGHATLASAHALWESGMLRPDVPALFETLSGRLSATKTGAWITLNFPSLAVEPVVAPTDLLESLGITTPLFVGYSRLDYLVRVETEEIVRGLSPDFPRLGRIDMQGVIVTAASDAADYDFVSRFFAPAIGINEDPVTGGAHCRLAPYWASEFGRDELTGYQASARGGVLRLRVAEPRVHLSGQAVTVLRGELV